MFIAWIEEKSVPDQNSGTPSDAFGAGLPGRKRQELKN
jgi:hypothetical protein